MQRLWIPGPLPSLNDLVAAAKGAGGTGRAYARLKRDWTNTVHLLAKRLKPMPGPVRMSFLWVEAHRRRDPDNIAAGGRKLVLDGLVAAKVLPNDGWAQIRSWVDTWAVGDTPGVHVEIQDA